MPRHAGIVAPVPARPLDVESASIGSVATDPAAAEPRTVLLVDDDFDSRVIYGRVFAHAGYRVMEATTGEQGLDIAHAIAPSIIVVDLGLPDIDGLEVTRALRADAVTRDALIIIVTAYVSATDAALAAQADSDLYIGKPILPRDLVAIVSQAATGRRPVTSPAQPPELLGPSPYRSRAVRPVPGSRPRPPRSP